MTLKTNSTIAGVTFLAYIAAGLSTLWLWGRVSDGADMASKLAGIAQHPVEVGGVIILDLVCAFAAITLGVTLYALTRDTDKDLAAFGLVCRSVEGVLCGLGVASALALKWLATSSNPDLADATSTRTLAAFLSHGSVALTSTFFAAGSLFFSIPLFRGRLIPLWMGLLGVIASAILVIGLPLQLVGLIGGTVASVMWIPMLLFEVPFGFWLIFKGISNRPGE